jgi:hypothetical protein
MYIYIYIYEVKIVAQACIQKKSYKIQDTDTSLSNNLYFTYIQAYNMY